MRPRQKRERPELPEGTLPVSSDRIARIYEFLISTPEINAAWNRWIDDHPLEDDVPTHVT